MFICLLYLTVINDLVFYFFSKSYYSYNTIFCLNLFGIANFFRLKYLFTENRIFNIDRVSQILFAKLLILILGILMFNLTFDFDVLIIFPLVYILIFFTVNIFMNILWRKNHQSKEKFDLINFSLGFVLIALASIQFYMQTNDMSQKIILAYKILLLFLAIKSSLFFLKKNNYLNRSKL